MDNYILNARVFPVGLALLPIVIVSVALSIDLQSYVTAIGGLGLSAVLVFVLAQVGRDAGKRIESGLWHSWGGPPSTRFFRWRDTTIPRGIKENYHQKMQLLLPQNPTVTEAFEQAEPKAADEAYRTWTHYVITNTRQPEAFSLLLAENINYGFRRNTLGLKKVALALVIVCMIGTYIFYNIKFNADDPSGFPAAFFIAELIFIGLLGLWAVIINNAFVRRSADSYALRLLEAINSLN